MAGGGEASLVIQTSCHPGKRAALVRDPGEPQSLSPVPWVPDSLCEASGMTTFVVGDLGVGQRALQEARLWLNTPYQHQASLRGVGCDCLGLVRGVWRALVGKEPERAPPYAPDWAEATGNESL